MIDATVIGSGPNGLAAAVTLARAGLEVQLVERSSELGGGLRTEELTLPGFRHDVCSAVHPMALASPFFRRFGLQEKVEFVIPAISYAHAFAPGHSAFAYRDLDRTVEALGSEGRWWRSLFEPLVRDIDAIAAITLNHPVRFPGDVGAAFAFGTRVVREGCGRVAGRSEHSLARALLAGVSAHAGARIPSLVGAGVGLALGAHAHAAGWGIPVGGSRAIADALVADFEAHGGGVVREHDVRTPSDIDPSRVVLCDTSPDFLVRFAQDRLPPRYRRTLSRFRRGVGVAKVDFALSGPVPWLDPDLASAPTVHVGGSERDVARSENAVVAGRVSDDPYVLVAQPTVVDPDRAPHGKHIVWAYIHVPTNSSVDAKEFVIRRLETFAPGFRDTILAAVSRSARELSAFNPNDVGGDIFGGALTPTQLVKRPSWSLNPWRTPVKGLYLCSASTPPGPAVHGMGGWHAARLALKDHFGVAAAFDR